MGKNTQYSKEELIEILEDKENEIDSLNHDLDYERKEVEDKDGEVVKQQEEIEELKYQLEGFETLKDNLQKQIKFEFLLENYDEISIDDLEDIVNRKKYRQKFFKQKATY